MQPKAFVEKLIYKVLWPRQQLYKWVAWHLGYRVRSGIFEGMTYMPDATWGNPGNKLLGTYEKELQPVWQALNLREPQVIYDIGAAEGYYAIGFATKCPQSEIFTWEMDVSSQNQLLVNARANHVEQQIHLSGECNERSLYGSILQKRPDVLLMDVEGSELDLCSERCIQSSLPATWVIECHSEAIVQELTGRFSASHEVRLIPNEPRNPAEISGMLPKFCLLLPRDLQRLVDEGRPFSTPWLVAGPLPKA